MGALPGGSGTYVGSSTNFWTQARIMHGCGEIMMPTSIPPALRITLPHHTGKQDHVVNFLPMH